MKQYLYTWSSKHDVGYPMGDGLDLPENILIATGEAWLNRYPDDIVMLVEESNA